MLPAVATTVPIVSCSVDQPQLFTNPSFEDGTLDGWTYTSSGANAVVVNADSSSSPFTTAADGEYYIDTHSTQLRGSDALFLRQTLYELDTSMTYTISFSMAAASYSSTGTNYCYIYVFKDSQTNANLLKEFQITMTSSGLPWIEYSFDFQPSSESHLILFLPECTGSNHVGFDNFEFLQPATTLCSTSYSTIPTTSSTLSSSLVSSQPVVTTPVASSPGAVSSSPAVSSSQRPIHSSSALVSATSVAQTQPSIASSSHASPLSSPSSSRPALASISSASIKPTSTAARAHTSPSSTMVSASRIRSASRSPSARTSSPLVSASPQSNQPSSASRISSSPVVVATIVPSSVASTGRVPGRSTIRASSLAASSSAPSLSKASSLSSTPLFISSAISRSTSPSALPSDQSTALSSLSPSSPTVKPTPGVTSEVPASFSESVPCETPTQTALDNSQPTSAGESGYISVAIGSTVTASPSSTASNSNIGNGSEGVTVTETSYSTTPTQLVGAETSGLIKSGDYHVSSSTMLVTKTVTVSRPSGDAVTEIVYQTVVECPEAEQTSSLAISAHITGTTGDGGSDTAFTALPSYTTLSTGFSRTGYSGTGSSDFSASVNSSGKVSPETSSLFFSGHSTANADDTGFETASTVLSGSPSLTTGSPDNSGSFSSSGETSSVVPNGTVDSETVTYVSTTFASSRPLLTAVHTPSFSHAPSPYGTDSSQSIEGSTTSWSVSPMASSSSAVYTGFGTRVENRSTLAIVVISLFMLASLL